MFSDSDSVHLAYGEANLDFPVKSLKYRYKIMCLFESSFIRGCNLLCIKLVEYELKYFFFPQAGNLPMISKYEDISWCYISIFVLHCFLKLHLNYKFT